MLIHRNIKYNITNEPAPDGKGRIFQYSINFGKLKKLNASGFQDAIKKVESIINNKLNKNDRD